MEHIDMNIERVCMFVCEKLRERERERGGWKEYESVRVSLREIEEKGKKRKNRERLEQREIEKKTENKMERYSG